MTGVDRRVLLGLPVIDHRYADCGRCPLDPHRKASPGIEVLAEIGRAYRPGGLLIVGEAPGQQEVVQRRPFVGPAGRCLDRLMERVGISREACVISNSVICRPPGNDLEGQPFVVERCNHRLFEEIQAYQPRVIVALGNHAMRALFGRNVQKRETKLDGCDYCSTKGKVRLMDASWLSIKMRYKQATIAGGNPEVTCKPCGGSGMRKYPFEVEQLSTDRKILDMAGSIVDIWNDPQWEHARHFPAATRYVVSTYHPSFLIREKDRSGGLVGSFFQPYAERHLRRALRLVSADYNPQLAVIHVDRDEQAPAFAQWLALGSDQVGRLYGVDIETEPREEAQEALPHEWVENEIEGGLICKSCSASDGDPRALEPCTASLESEDEESSRKKVRVDPLREKITCVGVYRLDTLTDVTVDLRNKTLDSALWSVLITFLLDPQCPKVFHNGSFDIAVLEATMNRIEV